MPQVSPQQLAARLSASSLASLVCATAAAAYAGEFQPPAVFDVRPGLRGQVGGFSWTIPSFGTITGRVLSPWVKVSCRGTGVAAEHGGRLSYSVRAVVPEHGMT